MSAAQSTKRHKIERTLAHENAGKHFSDKIQGRKRQCVFCKELGKKTPKGRAIKTTFECIQCGVALCRKDCFASYHTY